MSTIGPNFPPHQVDRHEFEAHWTRIARTLLTVKVLPKLPELIRPCLGHPPDEICHDGTVVWRYFYGEHDPTSVIVTGGGAILLVGGTVSGGKAVEQVL